MRSPFLLCTFIAFVLGCNGNNPVLGSCSAPQNPKIDLAQIGHISPKGRVQDKDYNQIKVVDQLIDMQTASIPYLIGKLDDETKINRRVMDFWSKVSVADIALVILTDFFTDSTWKRTTIPGVDWDEMLNRRNASLTGEEVLREFVTKLGRGAIKAKWERIWRENKDRLYWNQNEMCFKLR